jgi:hypothetical protein
LQTLRETAFAFSIFQQLSGNGGVSLALDEKVKMIGHQAVGV